MYHKPDSPPDYLSQAVDDTTEPLNMPRTNYFESARTLSTDSDKSDDLFLPASKPAQVKSDAHVATVVDGVNVSNTKQY